MTSFINDLLQQMTRGIFQKSMSNIKENKNTQILRYSACICTRYEISMSSNFVWLGKTQFVF